MFEVPPSGKHHGQLKLVASVDDFLISPRSTRLDEGSHTSLSRFMDGIRKGEEGIRREHRTLAAFSCLAYRNLHRIDSTHLTSTGANQGPLAAQDNRVALDVSNDGPSESQFRHLLITRLRVRNNLPLVIFVCGNVLLLS